MEAVYRLGPVSVAIDASPDAFSYYKEGVFYDKDCSNYSLDHQVGGAGFGCNLYLTPWSWYRYMRTIILHLSSLIIIMSCFVVKYLIQTTSYHK